MNRILEPEWLDELPANDPAAIRSRRDLQRVNAWMRHGKIFQRNLAAAFAEKPPKRIVELGAGDGTFLLRLARNFSKEWKGVEVLLIDRQNLLLDETRREFEQRGWRVKVFAMDVFEWLAGGEESDCTMANLFLHHFPDEKLQDLFRAVATQTKYFLACEPRRAKFPLMASRALGLIGCNAVTRHDAVISVRAGFADNELSQLWPDKNWGLREEPAGLFSHLFVANKREA